MESIRIDNVFSINDNSADIMSVCIFCLKSCSETLQNEQTQIFFKMIYRYFQEKIYHRTIAGLDLLLAKDGKLGCCPNCTHTLELFYETYHVLKCLELELIGILDRLKMVMKCADEDPARISDFRDWCFKEMQDMEKSMQFRGNFQRQSESCLTRNYPKVTLSRVSIRKPTQKDNGPSQASLSTEDEVLSEVVTSTNKEIDTIPLSQIKTEARPIENAPIPDVPFGSPDSFPEPQDSPPGSPNSSAGPPDSPPGSVELELLTEPLDVPLNSPPIDLQSSISATPDEPPTKKLKTSPIVPESDGTQANFDNSIPKPSEIKISEDSLPSSPTKRKTRQIFKCVTCKATFSSLPKLQTHYRITSCISPSEDSTTRDDAKGNLTFEDLSDDDDDDITKDMDWAADNDNQSVRDDDFLDDEEENIQETEKNCAKPRKEKTQQRQKAKPQEPKPKPKVMCSTNMDSILQLVGTSKQIAKPKQFRTTMQSKPKLNPLKCKRCKKPRPKFKNPEALQIHRKYLHTNGQAQMAMTEIHNKLSEYKIKLRNMSLQRHCCPDETCEKSYALSTELENHLKLHGQFKCAYCDKVLTSVFNLVDHEAKNCEKRKTSLPGFFTCARCEFANKLKTTMVSHYLEAHLSLGQLFQATCPICKQIFTQTDKVPLLHYVNYHDIARVKDPSSVINCSEQSCSAYFLSEVQQKRHRLENHSEKYANAPGGRKKKIKNAVHKCNQCPKVFAAAKNLKHHVWIVHSGKNWADMKLTPDGPTIEEFADSSKYRFVCSTCSKSFLKEVELHRHLKLHGKFPCSFCKVVEKYAPDLAIHVLSHGSYKKAFDNNTDSEDYGESNTLKFACPQCPFKSRLEKVYIEHYLGTHLKLEMDKKACPICNKISQDKYQTQAELKDWIYCHYMEFHDTAGLEETNIRKCDEKECGAYFRNNIQLHRHMVEIHWGGTELCQDCKKSFRTVDRLQTHRVQCHKVREEDFQFVCSLAQCGKRYEWEFQLDLHQQMHESLKDRGIQGMEMCDICGKACLGIAALNAHKKVHKQQEYKPKPKSIFCDQCGKCFSSKEKLNQHMVYHNSDNWAFSCSICSKKCPNKHKMEEHMRTHSKEKPYICSICGANYAHRHNLRIHVNSKHSDVMADLPKKYTRHNTVNANKDTDKLEELKYE